MSKRLSICIPTHQGRAKCLQEAIDSILRWLPDEARSECEICVSDNASEDGTRELAERYCRAHGDLFVYHRHEVNQQFIGNMLHLVEMARGDFCWFLGSDDQLNDSVNKVLELLRRYPEATGFSVNWIDYWKEIDRDTGIEFEPKIHDTWTNDFLLPRVEDVQSYTSAEEIMRHCGIPQTYISANIVSKNLWIDAVQKARFEQINRFHYYPHVYIMGRMVQQHANWVWCPTRMVRHRVANDAMLEGFGGEYHSTTLAVMDNLTRVWSELIGAKSPVYKELMHKQAQWAWPPRSIRYIKVQHSFTFADNFRLLRDFTKHLHFIPGFWTRTFPSLVVPHVLIREGRRLWHVIRPPVRRLRRALGLTRERISGLDQRTR